MTFVILYITIYFSQKLKNKICLVCILSLLAIFFVKAFGININIFETFTASDTAVSTFRNVNLEANKVCG